MDGGGGSARRGSSAARVAAARTQTAHMRVESSGATDSHGPPGTRSATRHVGVSSASSARGGSAMRAVGAAGHAREGLRTEITAEIAAVVDGVSQLRLGVAELREQFGARARPLRPIRAFSLQLFAEVINMRLECGVVVLRRRRAGAATP